ncbi:MAG: hypothetical protein H7343_22825 [Undibacterium sp.]|nr:hypothetical protein [Opitutaceae bacterium]
MKSVSFLIAASVVANGALVAVLLTRSPAPASTTSSSTLPTSAKTGAAPEPAGAATAVDPQLWSDLTAKDPAALLAKLRAAGFPPSVVRAILTAQIRADFAAQRRALYPAGADTPFWKSTQPTDPKLAAAFRDLAKEQTAQINQLFGGPDPDAYLGMSLYQRRQFGDLAVDKVSQLSRVASDYDELRQELYQSAGAGGGALTLLPEDRAKLALLDKEQQADFAQILSPEELLAYDLRSSRTASQMRYNLSTFAPTEAEFRDIFKIQKAFDDKNGQMMPGMTQEQTRARGEEQKKINEQIKASLGPERGAEYERANDFNYRQAALVAERLNLPKTAANDVWNLQKDLQKQMVSLYADSSLPPADRQAKQAAFLSEANAKVTAAMGERGATIYKQNGGGWLQPSAYRSTTGPTPATTGTVIRIGP